MICLNRLIQKCLVLCLSFFVCLAHGKTTQEEISGISEAEINHELQFLRQRKTDFKRDREFLSSEEKLSAKQRAEIRAIAIARDHEAQQGEKLRQQYVHQQNKVREQDAEEREKIENAMQAQEDRREDLRTKAYAQFIERKNRRILAAQVEVSEDQEYDIRIPIKANRSKPNAAKTKKWMNPE